MKTLKELLKSLKGKIPDGERVYCVNHGPCSELRYVVANSPCQAALKVCTIERVTDKELMAAAVEALGELAKEKGG